MCEFEMKNVISELFDEETTEYLHSIINNNSCNVFVRQNGYMVIDSYAYDKLFKYEKKRIEKGYPYQYFAEQIPLF